MYCFLCASLALLVYFDFHVVCSSFNPLPQPKRNLILKVHFKVSSHYSTFSKTDYKKPPKSLKSTLNCYLLSSNFLNSDSPSLTYLANMVKRISFGCTNVLIKNAVGSFSSTPLISARLLTKSSNE